jgi:hypothetical protein
MKPEKSICVICQKKTHHKSNIETTAQWECSHVDCPHRRSCSSEGRYEEFYTDFHGVDISDRVYNGS